MANATPKRIVCLSAEAADWLWRVGAWERVVGVTSFFRIPTGATRKTRVSGFSTVQYRQIVDLKPDLVIAFSDVQASAASELVRSGLTVLSTNQRTLLEIETTLCLLGTIVDKQREAQRCLAEFRHRLAPAKHEKLRPRVYFEEWNEPFVSGIGWVSELIERAGGHDIFAELRGKKAAAERVVSSNNICEKNPQVIFASWCGRPVKTSDIIARPGWDKIDAIQNNQIYEIPSADILQPGFRIVHGYEQIKKVLGGRSLTKR
jgi:iron complex transport system substrate-binding protein